MDNTSLQIQQLYHDKYHSRWSPRILQDITRLQAGEPLDYIIGWAPFLKCHIDLSTRPLIPRPETEFWTEKFIEHARHSPFAISHKPFRILDAFSGSGCIGIAIVKHLPRSRVDFADIDQAVLAGIKISAKKNRIAPSRYRLIRSDVLKNARGTRAVNYEIPVAPLLEKFRLRRATKNLRDTSVYRSFFLASARTKFFTKSIARNFVTHSYDAIVANPPYIAPKKYTQPSVLQYEPHKALFGGKDGLRFIRALITAAPKHLTPDGVLWMEHDPSQKKDIGKLLKARHYRDIQFHKDQYGRWRYVTARRRGK